MSEKIDVVRADSREVALEAQGALAHSRETVGTVHFVAVCTALSMVGATYQLISTGRGWHLMGASGVVMAGATLYHRFRFSRVTKKLELLDKRVKAFKEKEDQPREPERIVDDCGVVASKLLQFCGPIGDETLRESVAEADQLAVRRQRLRWQQGIALAFSAAGIALVLFKRVHMGVGALGLGLVGALDAGSARYQAHAELKLYRKMLARAIKKRGRPLEEAWPHLREVAITRWHDSYPREKLKTVRVTEGTVWGAFPRLRRLEVMDQPNVLPPTVEELKLPTLTGPIEDHELLRKVILTCPNVGWEVNASEISTLQEVHIEDGSLLQNNCFEWIADEWDSHTRLEKVAIKKLSPMVTADVLKSLCETKQFWVTISDEKKDPIAWDKLHEKGKIVTIRRTGL